MGGRDKQKQVKIYYLDIEQQWQPYAVALLHLDIHHNAYALKVSHPPSRSNSANLLNSIW